VHQGDACTFEGRATSITLKQNRKCNRIEEKAILAEGKQTSTEMRSSSFTFINAIKIPNHRRVIPNLGSN
jgi:hypothetical protein